MIMTIIISCYKKDKDDEHWQSVLKVTRWIGDYEKSNLNSKEEFVQ